MTPGNPALGCSLQFTDISGTSWRQRWQVSASPNAHGLSGLIGRIHTYGAIPLLWKATGMRARPAPRVTPSPRVTLLHPQLWLCCAPVSLDTIYEMDHTIMTQPIYFDLHTALVQPQTKTLFNNGMSTSGNGSSSTTHLHSERQDQLQADSSGPASGGPACACRSRLPVPQWLAGHRIHRGGGVPLRPDLGANGDVRDELMGAAGHLAGQVRAPGVCLCGLKVW